MKNTNYGITISKNIERLHDLFHRQIQGKQLLLNLNIEVQITECLKENNITMISPELFRQLRWEVNEETQEQTLIYKDKPIFFLKPQNIKIEDGKLIVLREFKKLN